MKRVIFRTGMARGNMHTNYIANVIKSSRAEKKISQQKMAKVLGIKQMTLSRIESGKRDVTFDELRKICHILEIRMIKLIRELEKIEKTASVKVKIKKS